MADDMELDLSANIEVNGTNSIDQAAQKVENLASNANEAEKNVSGISSAFGKLASAVKDNSLVKTFEYITKNIIELNKELKETPEVLAKIGTAKEKYYQASHDERYRNWQMTQMVSKQTGIYKGNGFVMDTRRPSESPSVEKAISAARLRIENADIAAHHNISSLSNKSRPLHKSLTSFYNFDGGIDINYASKELDSAEDFFFEERLKMSIQKYKKGLQDLLNKDKKQSSKVLLLEDLSHRDGNWYTGEKGFTTDFNTPVNEYGKAEFEKSSEEARARIQAAQEEEARIQEQKLEEQKKVLTNLMQQDPGRNVLLIGATEEAIAKAKEEELKAAEESVKAEKKGAKSSEMTAFQKEKVEAKAAEVAAYDKRTDKIAEENERKQQRWEAQAGTREFRNAHPELFAAGGQNWNPRYQTARAFSNIGTSISQFGPVGKVIGNVLDSLGAFFKATPAGIAATVSNLARATAEFGKAAVQAYAEIESIKTQLGVVFSNQTQAEDVFGQISQYAIKSPFGVQQTSELAVLLKQSGVYASDLMDTLKMLGDTAGGNMEKMKRIANNYAQIVSIGKASMLDMRQFAYAGIPIFEAVSKELGVSQQELRKLISDGKVTSDIIEKVFKDLTGINGIFNEATSKGAKTLKARLQNLKDARQLALSSVGEEIVNFGSNYGNDSLVNSIVSGLEDFYSWMKEHADVKNIERDVDTIARSDTRIKALEDLLEHAQKTGNKDLERLIKTELELQKNMYDVDKKRSIYSSSYDLKNERYDRYVEQFGKLTEDQVADKLESAAQQLQNLTIGGVDGFRSNFFSYEKTLTIEEEAEATVLRQLVQDLKDYQQAIIDVRKTTEEEIKANRERNLINAQQLAYDENQKAIGKEGSYASGFEQLYSLWTQSDEYKEQKQKAEIAFLQEAKNALIALKEFVDDEGKLDMTKLSYEQFSKSYNIDKAFEINRKLNVVEGKSQQQMTEDRTILLDQWEDMSNKIAKELAKDNRDHAFRAAQYSQILNGTSNEDFFDRFAKVLTEQLDYLKELKKAAGTKEVREMYDNMYNNLMASTFVLGVNTKGASANPNDIAKGSSQEFIPLWKRIIAQATGLSAEGITKAGTALSDYRNDMAVRNLTSNVMQAIMQSGGGMTSAMALARAGNQVARLKGTTTEVVQIDWKSTREAVKAFATQLSASTQVITAYKSALEEELQTYQSLVAAGYTTAETQEVKNQRYISEKTYKRLMETAGSQLVNAFGEDLVTREGRSVWLANNGKFYDSEEEAKAKEHNKEHEVAVEELVVTEDMFNVIKQTLPKIEEELREANARALQNKALEDMLSDIKNTYLQRFANRADIQLEGKTADYLFNNPEYLSSYFDSALTVVRNQYKTAGGDYGPEYKWMEGMSDNDILLEALKGDESEHAEEIARIIKIALEMVSGDTSDFINTEAYSTLEGKYRKKDVSETVNKRLALIRGSDLGAQASPTAWADEGGYSFMSKLIKDLSGFDKGYTMDDLYEAAADSGYLDEATRKTLYWQDALLDVKETLKSLGEETAKLVGDLSQKAFLTPFEKMGAQLVNNKDWLSESSDAMADLGKEALKSLGPIMAQAGFELVARGAMSGNWALVAGGLALAAAGGFTAGLGGALEDAKNNSSDNEAEKLQNLTDQLRDLLDQARKDALYYENNLRHKTALGINKQFDYKSVNDAVITPQGDIVTTDPKDYLIATKTPGQLIGGGGVNVTPVINCNVINNTSAKVRQEQTQNSDGSIDIVTIIEDAVGQYIASSRSDEAFSSRDYRLHGKQAIMN